METPDRPAPSSPLRAAFRLALFACVTAGVFSLLTIHKLFAANARQRDALCVRYTNLWCRLVAKAIGLKIEVSGAAPSAGTLLAPNHHGYVDIIALGAAAPCIYLSTTEIAASPVFGAILRGSGQVLISRENNRSLVGGGRQIAERLGGGHSVCVFLEGTSTGGDDVLPFRPSLIQPAIDAETSAVPVFISYRDSAPEIDVSEDVAYWKDHELGPHAWRFFGLKGVKARVVFGEPIPAQNHTRKTLAAACHAAVKTLQKGGETA